MPSLFLTLRACLYGAVFIATLICLGMAGHFQSVLASSDLTRFVPFALFVCCTGLLVISCLLGFSFFLGARSPITTRHELASLGLLGILWLALGIFLSTSDSQSADVECFASESSTVALEDSTADFQTEQYHAMYHVLMAFSLINACLVLFAFIALLTLATRRHLNGDYHMWYGPVTAGMVNDYSKSAPTSRPRRSQPSKPSILPTVMTEKRTRSAGPSTSRHKSHQSSSSRRAQRAHPVADRYTRQGGSGQSSLIGSNEFDAGGMVNPNRRPSQ
ncbi:UBIQUITIN-CONJUGAT-2 domain-containing protein [Mycena venus]|uniref:UBIQUITIN-CONJUGAT-2 domain-containing protein n=1 Tax=Mycena venus TaxID=2733690 RepID=A0A8H7CYP2_9AGAR|nr:UBIQUITIN-CONJUGAT-2 domain-containing protein [Mycena venus]